MSLLSFGDQGYGDELVYGALLTLQMATLGYVLALVAGTLIAVATLKTRGLRWTLWRFYASAFMSVPSLVVIFLIYFGGADMIASLAELVGLSARVRVSPFMAGTAGLGLVYSAYLAEGVRAAIHNVPRGQFEAAQALRLPRLIIWVVVIAPQAVRLALPGLVNLWIVVLKDTALVSLVGLKDIIAQAKMAAGVTKEPFLFYVAAATFFILMNALTLHVSGRLDRRVSRGVRAARA